MPISTLFSFLFSSVIWQDRKLNLFDGVYGATQGKRDRRSEKDENLEGGKRDEEKTGGRIPTTLATNGMFSCVFLRLLLAVPRTRIVARCGTITPLP
ncbi:hypothetical protein BDP55DRAFT_665995 [Colletotrichum godetiae]|uniref:Uncharacterized protein n=1 Tax=Colletotrichum godetiae TaxID=1209918 RepID=A0AAJ0AK36_9PEZI|nr:uncharacterized protein BDP55DRAFT_665995 [Colletotrichum godetiae]KAK1674705.1 hypothetical protein BDP55DRAFT_665995 [Colletotrichum godetiae]